MVNPEWETGMKSETVERRFCTYCGKTNKLIIIINELNLKLKLKGSEARWANPELNVGNYIKWTKNYTLYSTKLPKCFF